MKDTKKQRRIRLFVLSIFIAGFIYSLALAFLNPRTSYIPLTMLTPITLYGIYLLFPRKND
ncbi:hypothetical protein HF072_05830 [Bacillus sp. RO3]|nr:hypothetical protein [Bacillus sp. RO3]